MLTKEKLISEKYVEVSYDDATKVVEADWKGYLKLQQVEAGCSVISDAIRQRDITRHLSDHTELKVLSKEVQTYLTQTWFPHVADLGLKKIAVLVSLDVFAQATVNKVNSESHVQVADLTIRTFMNKKECMEWLNE